MDKIKMFVYLNSRLKPSKTMITSEDRIDVFMILKIAALLLFLPTASLLGQAFSSVEIQLSWGSVKGARGYAIEIVQEPNGNPRLIKTKVSQVRFELTPGNYKFRLAALNKFGKPAVWTDFRNLEVSGEERVQKMENIEKKEEKTETVEKEITSSPSSLFYASNFVPGLARINENDPTGILYPALITAAAAYGGSEYAAAARLSNDTWNDPIFLSLMLYDQSLPVLLYARQLRESHKAEFYRHRANQNAAWGFIAFVYIFHYVDSAFILTREADSPSTSSLPPSGGFVSFYRDSGDKPYVRAGWTFLLE